MLDWKAFSNAKQKVLTMFWSYGFLNAFYVTLAFGGESKMNKSL